MGGKYRLTEYVRTCFSLSRRFADDVLCKSLNEIRIKTVGFFQIFFSTRPSTPSQQNITKFSLKKNSLEEAPGGDGGGEGEADADDGADDGAFADGGGGLEGDALLVNPLGPGADPARGGLDVDVAVGTKDGHVRRHVLHGPDEGVGVGGVGDAEGDLGGLVAAAGQWADDLDGDG